MTKQSYKFVMASTLILVCSVIPVSYAADDTNIHTFSGPYDYTNPTHVRYKLSVVERHHLNKDVLSLTRGQSSSIADDLSFALRAFPNHHPALNAMAKLWRRHMRTKSIPLGIDRDKNPEYWFNKAITFAPHDGVVHLLYGIHLHKLGKLDQALKHYKKAEAIHPDLAEVHYNIGLLYLKRKEYKQAKEHGQTAYKLGYPLPGLKNKLIAAGVWGD